MGYPSIFPTGTTVYDKEKAFNGYTVFPSAKGAYRVPYEWIPQVEKPQEISVEKINVETFRVPGSLTGNQLGKITVIEGVDPNARLMTGGGAGEDEDEEINFCVATVRKSDLVK